MVWLVRAARFPWHSYSTIFAFAVIIYPSPSPPKRTRGKGEEKERKRRTTHVVNHNGNVTNRRPAPINSQATMAASQLEPPDRACCKSPFPDATDRGIVPSGRGAFLPVNMQISLGGEASGYESTVRCMKKKEKRAQVTSSLVWTRSKSDLCGRQRRTLVLSSQPVEVPVAWVALDHEEG